MLIKKHNSKYRNVFNNKTRILLSSYFDKSNAFVEKLFSLVTS